MRRIGFVGIGAMGFPMAKAIHDAGYPITFCARSVAAKEKGERAGFAPVDAYCQLSSCDYVFFAVRDFEQIRCCLEGEKGLLAGKRFKGCLVITSTIVPEQADILVKMCLEAGAGCISAPVSGGVSGAEGRTLLSIVSGSHSDYDLVRDVIDLYSGRVDYYGESPRDAFVVKSIIQMLVNASIVASSEAHFVAERYGIDELMLYDSVIHSSASSRIFEKRFPSLIKSGRDKVSSDTSIHAKDAKITRAVADSIGLSGCLPILRACDCVFSAAANINPASDAVFALEAYSKLASSSHCSDMPLKGKKLLVLGGVRPVDDIVRLAKEMGVFTIVADYYLDSPAKRVSDLSLNISTLDVERLSDVARIMGVDGVLTGFADINLEPCRQIADNLGLPFYATQEQIRVTCDKHLFKEACTRAGIPIVKEYSLETLPTSEDELEALLPLIVKPCDSYGSKGISVIKSVEQLQPSIDYARSYSPTGNVLLEPYIEGWDDSCLYLIIQNGSHSLAAMCDRIMEPCSSAGAPQPAELRFPSRHIDEYYDTLDDPIAKLIKDLGITDGTMFIQFFAKDGEFMVFESGYRMNGARDYVIESDVSGINSLEMHIRHALGMGFSTDECLSKIDPRFSSFYSIVAVNLVPGIIDRIEGLDKITNSKGFVNMVVYYEEGDVIEKSFAGTLKQEFARIYLKADSEEELDRLVSWTKNVLRVIGPDGTVLNSSRRHV